MDIGPTIDKSVVTGPFTSSFTMWALTVGGRIKETAWMDHRGWRAIECITKVRGNCVQTNDRSPSIETVRPACNVTLRSFGRATFTRPGRPCRLTCRWQLIQG